MLGCQPAPLARAAGPGSAAAPALAVSTADFSVWFNRKCVLFAGCSSAIFKSGLPTGIYNPRADLGKQNICQGECSEHFNSQPDGLRMERVRVSEWNTALSSALQKPSIPPAGHSVKF